MAFLGKESIARNMSALQGFRQIRELITLRTWTIKRNWEIHVVFNLETIVEPFVIPQGDGIYIESLALKKILCGNITPLGHNFNFSDTIILIMLDHCSNKSTSNTFATSF